MNKIHIGIFVLIYLMPCALSTAELVIHPDIDAGELADRLVKGSAVIYNNVTIRGDLNLSRLGLHEGGPYFEINSPIIITNSILKNDFIFDKKIFRDILILNNNTFCGSVSFSGSKFIEKPNFDGSAFDSQVLLSNTYFLKGINLKRCIFKDGCNFAASSFQGVTSFEDISFLNGANFRGSIFRDDFGFENISSKNSSISFVNSTFLKNVEITQSQFKGEGYLFREADFSGQVSIGGSNFSNFDVSKSNFNGSVKILNAIFDGSTVFRNAIFNKEAAIFGCIFNGNSDLRISKFMQPASFKASTFNGSALFEKAEFDKRAQFSDALFLGLADFTDCIFKEDAVFEGAEFKSDLVLKRTDYKDLFIRWDNITNLPFDDSSYLLLIENFKKLGFWSDADNCYYAYRSERNQFLPFHNRLVDFILLLLYGYGTKPGFSLFWIIFTIFSMGVILHKWKILKKDSMNASFLDAILFSAANFASGAKSLSELISTPTKFTVAERYQFLVIIERFLGMLLFALFLISLARTVIR